MNQNVIVAMSGGVDSSVAAFLLRERGFQCSGVTMKLFSNEDIGKSRDDACCSLADAADARSVANKLGIPHYVFNFSRDFDRQVINRFIDEYENGRTPNPCIDCNRYLKFGKLLLRAEQMEHRFVATGHYARIDRAAGNGRFLLKKALDKTKDQSYVLYMLTQAQLARILFPLGEMKKSEVRDIALGEGFINAGKGESQDICFVPDGKYADFIESRTGRRSAPGSFIDNSGKVIGTHKGLIRYTIGQRKGLGMPFPGKMYVCAKNAGNNTVTLGDEGSIYAKVVLADGFNLISQESLPSPARVKAVTRYGQTAAWAVAEMIENGRVRLEFDEPQRATAAGQAVVLYEDDVVLGGGIIAEMR
jgi:tRNA-specific 2-thiouridylase